MQTLSVGQDAPRWSTQDLTGAPIALEDFAGKPLLLAFHRFAACPLCNLRTDQLIQYYPIWHSKGLEVVTFFQSQPENIQRFVERYRPPFQVVADPDRVIYNQYGIENSTMKAMLAMPKVIGALRKGYGNDFQQDGDQALIPGDFLINPDLTIHTAHYGRSAADHLSIREIVNFLDATPEMA
jgi:thioredoxin-dependent peroxiredoxin